MYGNPQNIHLNYLWIDSECINSLKYRQQVYDIFPDSQYCTDELP